MKTRSYLIAAAGILVLGACAPSAPVQPVPDVNAIRTSAAYTVVAEFTLTASLFTPTSSPPTETPTLEPATSTPTEEFTSDPTLAALGTPAALCDNLAFDLGTVDVTIPDGTPMTPGQEFVKTWRIRNTGSCAWGDGYELTYSYGERMNGQPVPIGQLVPSGEEVEVSVNFTAPTKVGEFTSAWQMTNPKGIPFGKAIFVKIIVQ